MSQAPRTVPGALSIPLGELKAHLKELPKGREIVAYCRGPYSVMAVEAVELLRKKGFRAQRMEHGVVDFRARGCVPVGCGGRGKCAVVAPHEEDVDPTLPRPSATLRIRRGAPPPFPSPRDSWSRFECVRHWGRVLLQPLCRPGVHRAGGNW